MWSARFWTFWMPHSLLNTQHRYYPRQRQICWSRRCVAAMAALPFSPLNPLCSALRGREMQSNVTIARCRVFTGHRLDDLTARDSAGLQQPAIDLGHCPASERQFNYNGQCPQLCAKRERHASRSHILLPFRMETARCTQRPVIARSELPSCYVPLYLGSSGGVYLGIK